MTLGLSVTTSSATLDPSSPSPFFLIVTVRILTTPRQDSPITLATHLNPLGGIGNRSFDNIVCIHPKTENAKRIEIGPRGWPHYLWDPDNLRDSWDFVTVPSDGRVEIKHQVDPAKIADAGLKSGEKYQASLTDRCLGTRWWAFGSLEELDGRRFQQWREGAPREGEDGNGRFLVGQRPDDLALVIEKGTTEFEVE